MIFRELSKEIASTVMDYCEANGIDYDIWNAADVWFGGAEIVEFGCDWDMIPAVLLNNGSIV